MDSPDSDKERPLSPEEMREADQADAPEKPMHSALVLAEGIVLLILGIILLVVVCNYTFRHFNFFMK